MAQQQTAVLSHCSLGPGAPNSGSLYIGQDTTGVSCDYPAGTTATFEVLEPSDLQGGGPTFIRQQSAEAGFGFVSRVQVGCLTLPETSILLSSGAVVLAPPIPGFQSAQTSNFALIVVSGDGLDWIGGIDLAGAVVGTEIVAVNRTGNTVNILSDQFGGVLSSPYPSILWGFRETMRFRMIATNKWAVVGQEGAYSGGGSAGGGRLIHTTDATPTMLIGFPKGSPGVAYECDVSAQLTGGSGTTLAYWQGVRAAIDGSNTLQASSKGAASGTNAGAPPTGWDLSFTTGTTYNQLNFIGAAATNITAKVNNIRIIVPGA